MILENVLNYIDNRQLFQTFIIRKQVSYLIFYCPVRLKTVKSVSLVYFHLSIQN